MPVEEIIVDQSVVDELRRLLALAEQKDKKRGVIYHSDRKPRGSYLLMPYPFETFNLVAEAASSPESCLHKYLTWEGDTDRDHRYMEAFALVMVIAPTWALKHRDTNIEFLELTSRLAARCRPSR